MKLHTKKMQIPTRRFKKELHRQLMRSGPGYQKEGMITKKMNIRKIPERRNDALYLIVMKSFRRDKYCIGWIYLTLLCL